MLKAKLTGGAMVKKAVAEFGPKVLRPAARAGTVAASQLVAKAAKAAVPEGTKSLKKAIGYKVAARKTGTGYTGVVGPRKDSKRARLAGKAKFRRLVGTRKRAGGAPAVAKHADPVKYAKQVEFGRRAVRVKTKKLLSDGGWCSARR